MSKNLIDVNKELDTIQEKIKTFDTDERKEIKKNNKLIADYINKLMNIKDLIFSKLKDNYVSLVPLQNNNLNDEKQVLKNFLKNVVFLSTNSFIYKMEIDKNLHEIRYSNSLEKINENVLDLIKKFDSVGIKLNKKDFNYSISLYKYMSNVFENIENDNFNEIMRENFELLYWECPSLISHIYLGFMLLLNNYKDKFELFIKNHNNSKMYDDELNKYIDMKKSLFEKESTDEYLLYQDFLSGKFNINDYLKDSVYKKNVISKFVDFNRYCTYELEEKEHFYEQIRGIYYDLCETLFISKYKFVIDKIKDIYLNKDKYLNNYSTLLKEIKILDKQREKMNNKLFNIFGRLEHKKSNILLNKYNSLFNKINSKIEEIIEKYKNYDEIVFINDVVTKLNEDSTYYDAFKIFEGNYSYFLNVIKDKDCNYNDYIDYLYGTFLNISKSIPFTKDIDIEDTLFKKYELFDANIDFADKYKLKEELEFIIRLNYIEKGNVDLDRLKLIIDVKKIVD